jgi:hypothetical protein
MLELLRESWDEVAKRQIALLKCFWLSVVLYCAVLAMMFMGYIDGLWAFAGLLVVFVLTVTPGAVRWHRHVIVEDKVDWKPLLPNGLSLAYAAKLLAATFALAVIKKFIESIVNDLVMPIYGALLGPVAQPPTAQLHSIISAILSLLVFVLIFGTWMLHLPEGALDSTTRGARKSWPPGHKRNYLKALATFYVVPVLVTSFAAQFFPDDMLRILIDVVAALICGILGLSLLSVTYRRNMNNSGLTKGLPKPLRQE